jgi:predicted DNA-binding transcriptional regulator AlpA
MLNQHEGTRYIRNGQLAEYLGVSAMTIWRWQRDPKLDFPQPSVVNGNCFTSLDEVDRWMRARVVSRAKKVA